MAETGICLEVVSATTGALDLTGCLFLVPLDARNLIKIAFCILLENLDLFEKK